MGDGGSLDSVAGAGVMAVVVCPGAGPRAWWAGAAVSIVLQGAGRVEAGRGRRQ
jgi:hypothetical protein